MNLRERRFDRRARKFADITHRAAIASRAPTGIARRRATLEFAIFFASRARASNLRRDRSPRRRPPRGGYAARPSRAALGDASSTARVARDLATSRMRRATLDRARRALASRARAETALEDAKSMIEYARARWRVGARGDARGVLEHASVALRRRGEDAATSSAIARARTAWAHLARERGERGTARDAARDARDAARESGAPEDGASADAMWTLLEAREEAKDATWADVVEGARRGAGGGAGGRCAAAGAETLAALTRRRARDALEAAETCEIALRGMSSEELREAKDAPHGWAIASAMKALGHVERLTPSGSSERALELYERAAEYAKDVALSEHPGAMASRMIAEDLQADCALARAQAYAALGDVENAETFAARAVSAAEALGDEKHPRVGAAIAVSGDVYVAKALRSMSNDEKTSLGDGAGVMFAEGLYKSAIKLMHYPHVVEDGKIVLDYEARHLCALLHARYSSILRASGGQREREANAWLESAKILWPDERGDDEGVDGVDIVTKAATKLGVKHGPSVLIDLQQMAPLTMGA